MKPADAETFKMLLAGTYALHRLDLTPAMSSIWWESMKPFDLAAVRDAFNRHAVNADNGQFCPKPADIVRLIGGGTQDRALLAWAKVQKAIHQVGRYRSVVFDDPLIHATLSDMGGWVPLGDITEDDLPFRAKEFENRYRGLAHQAAVPAYPAVLHGITDRDNASCGFRESTPVLIGDPARARLVLERGGDGAQLQVTHLQEAIKQITAEGAA